MGLLQQAYKTYESHKSEIGTTKQGQEPLAPVSHMITRAQIEITVNQKGEFVSASLLGKDVEKIIVPVTEESSGRTSAPCPHPLDEQLSYLVPYNSVKREMYLNQLGEWKDSDYSNVKLLPVYKYVSNGTIIDDLVRSKVVSLNTKGQIKDEKALVRWIVNGVGESSGPCWTDKQLFSDYIGFYRAKNSTEENICMISGDKTTLAKQHPKGIISMNGNAKLISANDKSGFTFRGRFEQDWQAATIGYEQSQEAHSALRWLAANQGVIIGGRTFLCWNPEGLKAPSPLKPLFTIQPRESEVKHVSYRKELYKTMIGWKEQLSENASGVTVIAVFDAATTGRLAITYYNELLSSDFLDRLYEWDEHCQWFYTFQNLQQAPSLRQIIECAYGIEREEKGVARLVVDDRILRQHVQRLLSCRVDCAKFPLDILQQLVQRASTPQAFNDKRNFRRVLSTACAVIKKVYYDYRREEIEMALEPQKKDRSYQFGRLLAVMEKIETDTYSEIDDKRVTNAMRLQSVFCREPMHYAEILERQMEKAYLPKLKPKARGFYKKTLGQIFDIISQEPESNWNKPLGDTYLIGYYLQRNELYTRKNKEEAEDESAAE